MILEEKGYDIPIVCYTVVNDRSVHNELRQLGVKEIVSKKALPSKLEETLKKYLR